MLDCICRGSTLLLVLVPWELKEGKSVGRERNVGVESRLDLEDHGSLSVAVSAEFLSRPVADSLSKVSCMVNNCSNFASIEVTFFLGKF